MAKKRPKEDEASEWLITDDLLPPGYAGAATPEGLQDRERLHRRARAYLRSVGRHLAERDFRTLKVETDHCITALAGSATTASVYERAREEETIRVHVWLHDGEFRYDKNNSRARSDGISITGDWRTPHPLPHRKDDINSFQHVGGSTQFLTPCCSRAFASGLLVKVLKENPLDDAPPLDDTPPATHLDDFVRDPRLTGTLTLAEVFERFARMVELLKAYYPGVQPTRWEEVPPVLQMRFAPLQPLIATHTALLSGVPAADALPQLVFPAAEYDTAVTTHWRAAYKEKTAHYWHARRDGYFEALCGKRERNPARVWGEDPSITKRCPICEKAAPPDPVAPVSSGFVQAAPIALPRPAARQAGATTHKRTRRTSPLAPDGTDQLSMF